MQARTLNGRFRTAGFMWGLILGQVVLWELSCCEGQLLSQGVDRAIVKHPVATRLAIAVTALHLANVLDHPRLTVFDPYAAVARLRFPATRRRTRWIVA